MASEIIPVELDTEALEWLEARTCETGESQSDMVRRLVQEAMRMERHPGIVFRDGPVGRRPSLLNGPDVWEAIPAVLNPKNPSDAAVAFAAESLGIPEDRVRDALGYYAEFTEEIDFWIERNERVAEEARARMQRERASA